jgi:hypothetical protein
VTTLSHHLCVDPLARFRPDLIDVIRISADSERAVEELLADKVSADEYSGGFRDRRISARSLWIWLTLVDEPWIGLFELPAHFFHHEAWRHDGHTDLNEFGKLFAAFATHKRLILPAKCRFSLIRISCGCLTPAMALIASRSEEPVLSRPCLFLNVGETANFSIGSSAPCCGLARRIRFRTVENGANRFRNLGNGS